MQIMRKEELLKAGEFTSMCGFQEKTRGLNKRNKRWNFLILIDFFTLSPKIGKNICQY